MIHALLHGKLSREQENMEDVLTSNVFGLLTYIPLKDGLLPFLAAAESINGLPTPLVWLNDSDSPARLTSRPEFWPTWNEKGCLPCEPDVVLRFETRDRRRLMVCVEAKYLSGKSSHADAANTRPVDQLAREWDNLHSRSRAEAYEPVLVYLTADIGCPVEEIRASIAEFNAKKPDALTPHIVWLSWRRLSSPSSPTPASNDLAELMRRIGLTYFGGFRHLIASPVIRWRFSSGFYWHFEPQPQASWRFRS